MSEQQTKGTFQIDIDRVDALDIKGRFQYKAPRQFTITISEDSDEEIAARFDHEFAEFVNKFCDPTYPGMEALLARLTEDEYKTSGIPALDNVVDQLFGKEARRITE